MSSSSTTTNDVAFEATSNTQQSRGAPNQKCKGRPNSGAPSSHLSLGQKRRAAVYHAASMIGCPCSRYRSTLEPVSESLAALCGIF